MRTPQLLLTQILSILISCSSLVYSQSRRLTLPLSDNAVLTVNLWTKEDGLPHWAIGGIFEDSRGLVWIQSGEHLCYFNGQAIINVEPKKSSLYKYYITMLGEDHQGNIWRYFTPGLLEKVDIINAINIYDPVEEKFYDLAEYLGSDHGLFLSNNVQLFSLNQTIYIVDYELGNLWKYDGQLELAYSPAHHLDHKDGTVYLPGPEGYFWAIDLDKNTRLLDHKGKVIKHYQQLNKDEKSGYFLTQNGQLWFYFHSNLPFPLVLPNEIKVKALPKEDPIIPSAIISSSFNEVLGISTINTVPFTYYYPRDVNRMILAGGEHLLPQDILKFIVHQLTEVEETMNNSLNFTPQLLRDGTIIIPTAAGLLNLEIQTQHFRQYLPGKNIRGITVEDTSKIAAVVMQNDGNDIIELDLLNKLPKIVRPHQREWPYSLFTYGDAIWCGLTTGELELYNKQWQCLAKYPAPEYIVYQEAKSIQYVTDSTLWHCTNTGVIETNVKNNSSRYVFKHNFTHVIHQDQNDDYWIGTDQGLYHLRSGTYFLDTLIDGRTIPISHIYEDAHSTFWISSQRGLIKWKPFSDKYELFDEEDGFSSNIVHAAYPDSRGRLWLSSNYGVMSFDTSTFEVFSFFQRDGLAGNEQNFISHTRASDGTLYFGGMEGITAFHPDSVPLYQEKFNYDISLHRLQLSDQKGTKLRTIYSQELLSETPVTIPRSARQLLIKVFFPVYRKVAFVLEWRLGGQNQQWQKLSDDYELFISYLPYGPIDLEIRARFTEDSGVPVYKKIALYKPYPFYFYAIFWCILAFLIMLLAWGGWRYYSRQLKLRNKQLQQQVLDRTRSLNKQKQQLEHLNQAKDKLFRNISHELRTPTSIISVAAEQLLEHRPEEESLQLILSQSKYLKKMIDSVLSLSKLELGLIQKEIRPVKWQRFVRTIFSNFVGLAERKHISFELILPEETSIYVKTDPEKVEHILNNLIANALKFTPEGGRVIVRSETSDHTAEIVVADSGPGVSVEEQETIFNRYHQGRTGQQTENGGYGIGLALCREYAGLLGGQIWVESESEQGASFFVHLPLDPVSESELEALLPTATNNSKKNQSALSKILTNQDQKAHLLVVEDNFDLLRQLKQILEKRYHVHTATNGEEAFQQLSAQPELFDLIISDIMMPLVDGFMLLNKIRTHPQLAYIPILFLTAVGSEEEKIKALRLGVDAFLTKPFELVELLTQVENLVNRQQQGKKYRATLPSNDELADNTASPSEQLDKTQSYDEVWLQELETIVRKNLSRTDLKITDIAFELHLSERTLRNYIKAYTGGTPLSYLQKARLDKALQLIKQGKYKTLGEIANAVGFKDAQYFSRLFKKEFGKLPTEYL